MDYYGTDGMVLICEWELVSIGKTGTCGRRQGWRCGRDSLPWERKSEMDHGERLRGTKPKAASGRENYYKAYSINHCTGDKILAINLTRTLSKYMH